MHTCEKDAKKRLLIIEDEKSLAKQMKWALGDRYDVVIADCPEKARQMLASGAFPLATLDLGLPPTPDVPDEGFRLLEAMQTLAPHTKMIVITGNAERENAIKAIGLGATDFCAKPVDIDVLRIILKRAFSICELESENRKLRRRECQGEYTYFGMLGVSPLMADFFSQVRRVGKTGYPVLIRGETGTGKELAARAVHSVSERSDQALVTINCGAIPENLLETELFGHEKGAFTGATERKPGKLELADKGTVFLDEIGDMPLTLQMKLLRFLQAGTIERVGGMVTMQLDVRVIAATHVDLDRAVAEQRFREDLYYRLNVVPLKIPPLRERREDILPLANQFVREESEALKRDDLSLSPMAAAALTAYTWPGNVRELRHRICRAITKSEGGIIAPSGLGLNGESENVENSNLSIKSARDEAEYRVISQAMAITGNNISQAAKLLDVSRSRLHDLLKKHGMGR